MIQSIDGSKNRLLEARLRSLLGNLTNSKKISIGSDPHRIVWPLRSRDESKRVAHAIY